jgi:phage tail-like protein
MASPAPGSGKPPAWMPPTIQWQTNHAGKVERKNGSIVRFDDTGKEKVRWNFVGGRPTKWTGPTFNATGNEVAIETLEIAHEGVTRT